MKTSLEISDLLTFLVGKLSTNRVDQTGVSNHTDERADVLCRKLQIKEALKSLD